MENKQGQASYTLLGRYWLRFERDDTERAYVDNLAKQNGERAKIGTTAALLVLSTYVAMEVTFLLPARAEWTWDSVGLRLLERATILGFILLIRAAPAIYLEYVLCVVETSPYILMEGSDYLHEGCG